ncbi:hypothetical protein CH330_07575 [candidate division WOR-3 bacterium JGI_Cruoil_03_51_56]|uniref:Uncharacterized protein n=1 Tax=candidate division WOR-3 bacterium JGI_Cruoil_03_51_56 TaxID=1973747 RepID=A0A235BQP8_UNCW3|nr:MAG: hypothetical protein CH330_07575 [candidate division WOR-3 bacterium JGI_Cruoil_03_51_56]
MSFKAVIPAAGEGQRLRPHTYAFPKVLLEVAGKPIIGHIMDRLLPARPDEVCVVVGEHGDKIQSYLIEHYDCHFRFVTQDNPKGLGDAVYRAHDFFHGEPVMVLLGDTIVDLEMSELVGKENVIGVKEVDDPQRFGIVELDGEKVQRIAEKPEKPHSNLAVVGVYYFNESEALFGALSHLIEKDRRTRGEYQLTDALQMMVDCGVVIRTRRIEHWLDCGTPEALLATNRYLLGKNCYFKSRKGTVFLEPVYVHDTARIENSVIGPNVSIGANARIHSSVIWDSIVNREALVEHALLEKSLLGEKSVVKGSVQRLNLSSFSRLEMG